MVSIQEYDLRNIFKTEKNFLTLTGFYARSEKKNFDFLYNINFFLTMLISFTQLFSMIILIVLNYNDFSKIIQALLFFITHVSFMGKLMYFYTNRMKMLDIEKILENPIFYNFKDRHLNIFINAASSIGYVAKIYRFLCFATISFYGLAPFLDEMENGLPLPGWIPFDVINNVYLYCGTFTFQMISITLSAFNNSTFDLLDCTLITIASSLLELLMDNMKHIDYGNKNAKSEVKRNIKLHIEILRFVTAIEDMFTYGIFVQFIASCLIISVTAFQMIVGIQARMQFTVLVAYFMTMTIQVAIYCWYGNDITFKNKELTEATYMSNWYISDVETRKLLIILLERTKKPVLFTAGKFFTLSLATLVAILKSSYSYCAVLQRVYRDKK